MNNNQFSSTSKGQYQKLYVYWENIITVIAVSMTIFQLYTAIFGVFESMLQRSLHILFALVLSFMIYDSRRVKETKKIPWYDIIIILLCIASYGYVAINAQELASRLVYVTPLTNAQLFFGIVGILVLLEAARRNLGKPFAIIVLACLLYALFGSHLPGALEHRGYSLSWIVDHIFYTSEGIFGIPAGVSATFIFIFILFGTFLEKTGAGEFFIQSALAVMGKYRGGPAKTAVVASGFMGMLSGSAVANVVTTGAFTIPLMKKLGYKPHFAGAVEACASSGGQFTPPIMGATAFIIAQFTGIPYVKVALAAAIPAILYYTSIGLQVHFRAIKEGIEGMTKDELPDFKREFIKGFHFLLPLVTIIYLLIIGYSPLKAGVYSTIILLIVTFIRNPKFIKPLELINLFDVGARRVLDVAIACAAAGIVIGVISLTGLGLRFSSLIMELAGGIKFVALLLTMLTAILLGMGLPTVGAYVIQAALIVPALIKLGVPVLAAHFFAFYFAIISAVTPPVALAAYAASGVAGSSPTQTAWAALKLALSAFIVPFMFAYGPALILIGEPIHIILSAVTAFLGILALSAGIEGWFIKKTNLIERILLFVAALTLIKPGLTTDVAGLVIFGTIIILQKIRKKDEKRDLPGGFLKNDSKEVEI